MNPNEYAASLLGEVKLAEKKLAKLEEQRGNLEGSIKAALRAGDRPRAEKLALAFEETRAEIRQKEAFIAQTRTQFEEAKRRAKDMQRGLKSAKTMDATVKALEGINKSMEVASSAEDMLRQIEEQVAISEARLEIASDDAEKHASKVIVDHAPEVTAASILEEFEQKPTETKPQASETPPAQKGQPPKKTIGEEGPSADQILKEFE